MARSQSQSYDSQNDSGDDLLADYDTIATVPLARSASPERTATLAEQSTYVTQPTQKIEQPYQNKAESSAVQVAASSPTLQSPIPLHRAQSNGGILAKSIAPPGTQFRPLWQQRQSNYNTQKSQILEFSDDERRVESSSDDESNNRQISSDIKPSKFQRNGKPIDLTKVDESSEKGLNLQKFVYAPASPQKRSADIMANAYGNSKRPSKIRQLEPSKAQLVEEMTLNDVPDLDVQHKIQQIRKVLPNHSIANCQRALMKRNSNVTDAMDLLVEEDSAEQADGGAIKQSLSVDLTMSDDELHDSTSAKFTVKRNVQVPSRRIADKWASTQRQSQRTMVTTSKNASADQKTDSLTADARKPKKRLVQGRKTSNIRSFSSSPPPVPIGKAGNRKSAQVSEEELEAESSVSLASEQEDQIEDSGQTLNLLNFINTCTETELIDVSMQPTANIGLVLSKRPFRSLNEIRAINWETSAKTKTGRNRVTKKQIGDRLVEACLEMFASYEAVDELVTKCEELGKPIMEITNQWSLDAFKESNGELEMLDFDPSLSFGSHDSGIGTPSSSVHSGEDGKEESKISAKKSEKPRLIRQPALMSQDIKMKDYQVVGLNWLALLFSKGLSCILADDMGLGKTCQVIGFLAHLAENGERGPHLIIVPGSTLENWLREFSRMCPALRVEPYYGDLKERAEIRGELESERGEINVIITTYDTATKEQDSKFLRQMKPTVCVYDEGHYLKNSQSDRYKKLMRISGKFRLLLTGTPLQNNLQELVSLLAFILPQVFHERKEDLEFIFRHKAKTTDTDHTALLSSKRIDRARSMMTPFILRRKKHQVLKHLPRKISRVEYCSLTAAQDRIYQSEAANVRQVLIDDSQSQDTKTSKKAMAEQVKIKTNVLMSLRKAAIHPLLFRNRYDNETIQKMSHACLKEASLAGKVQEYVLEDMGLMSDFELHDFCEEYPKTMRDFKLKDQPWMDSGKVQKLVSMLQEFRDGGHRTLVFSQFRMVMDILEKVFETIGMPYSRLDGETKMNERQDLIDQFHEDESIAVFLLSTKAGGAGINLECANKVVIFDSSFNPQEDVQAENRAHRVGQTREVEVVRLVTSDTIEEQIMKLGETKLVLDEKVAGEQDKKKDEEAENEGVRIVENMMKEGLDGLGHSLHAGSTDCSLREQFLNGLRENGLHVE